MSVYSAGYLTSSNMALINSTEEYSVEICSSTCRDLSRISLMVSVFMREWCLVRSLWISCTWSLSFWISVWKVWITHQVSEIQYLTDHPNTSPPTRSLSNFTSFLDDWLLFRHLKLHFSFHLCCSNNLLLIKDWSFFKCSPPHPVAVLIAAAVLHKGRLSALRQQNLCADVSMWVWLAHRRWAQRHVTHGWRMTLDWQRRLHPVEES